MGYLRLLLASLVLASHTPQFAGPFAGIMAVECFFALSGFYMQMIITERYAHQPRWRRKFLESRFLRIFAPYWLILSVITLLSIGLHFLIHDPLPPAISSLLQCNGHSLITLLSNLFIFGTDMIKLMRTSEGCAFIYWRQLIIPTVWSVGIELMFYLLAPLLLACRSRVLAAIVLCGLVAKVLLLWPNAETIFRAECGDGLLNSIFPLDLSLFLAGALGYRFYASRLQQKPARNHAYLFMTAAVTLGGIAATFVLGKHINPPLLLLTYYGFVLLIVLLLPLLFRASRSLKFDRLAGDFSYPFYLWHYFLITQLMAYVTLMGVELFAIAEIVTLAAAWMIAEWVEIPLSRYRHRRFRDTA